MFTWCSSCSYGEWIYFPGRQMGQSCFVSLLKRRRPLKEKIAQYWLWSPWESILPFKNKVFSEEARTQTRTHTITIKNNKIMKQNNETYIVCMSYSVHVEYSGTILHRTYTKNLTQPFNHMPIYLKCDRWVADSASSKQMPPFATSDLCLYSDIKDQLFNANT